MRLQVNISEACKARNLRPALIAAILTLTGCNKGEEEHTPIAPPSKELAIKVLEERQAADGDKVLSTDLKPAPDRRFAGMVTIKSKSGEITDWACRIRPPRIGQPIGGYSCYLDR